MKFLFDVFPVLLFFVAYKLFDLYIATATAIVATFLQIGWSKLARGHVDRMLWVSLVVITVFGGATLLLANETFIKWKPTVLYWIFAAVLIGGAMFGKNLIRSMMQSQIVLPDAVWDRLMMSWVVFFVVMGGLNLYVAYNYSTDAWVNFKLFGGIGLMIVFVLLQALFLAKHVQQKEH